MPTEWLRVMLDEIARKHEDARRAREELAARARDGEPLPPNATPTTGDSRWPKDRPTVTTAG